MKTIAILLALASTAYAGDCRIQRNAAVVADFAVVPYAVPIGIPVAQVTPAFYSFQGAAQAYRQPAPAQPAADPEWAEFQAWKANRARAQAATVSALQQNCVKCHSEGGKGFAAFELPANPTAEQRIHMSQEVLAGRMPKGRKLSADDVGRVLGELLQVEDRPAKAIQQKNVPTAAPPPPSPPGE